MNTRVAVVTLFLVVVLLAGGNFLINKSGSEAETPATLASFSGVVTSETSTLVIFNLRPEVEALRQAKAARLTRRAAAEAARKKERRDRFRDLPGSVSRSTLETIASCESGGDPEIVSSSGLYHGKYQFSPATWESVGGEGLPSEASEAEQDFRAALLYHRSGPGQWPTCGI
ncbi:MAG: transglycosylase family protein [Solirubrobacterales bacterium]